MIQLKLSVNQFYKWIFQISYPLTSDFIKRKSKIYFPHCYHYENNTMKYNLSRLELGPLYGKKREGFSCLIFLNPASVFRVLQKLRCLSCVSVSYLLKCNTRKITEGGLQRQTNVQTHIQTQTDRQLFRVGCY